MESKVKQRKKIITDNMRAGIFRWWMAGMCYFFIGFGTQAGVFLDPLDLIFFLGIGIGLATIVIYNPIAYRMFDIKRRGEITNQAYHERKGWKNAAINLTEIFRNIFLVIIVYLTYQGGNLLINQIGQLPAETILIPGEPFGFATLYSIYYYMLLGLADTIREARKKGGQA